MSWAGLDGDVQLATFHPKYQFEGEDADDVTNWTNRSPWPIFHLLREKDVSDAVESYGEENSDEIWKTNQSTMRKKGKAELAQLINPGSPHEE